MLMRQAAPATMQAMLGRRNQKRKCLLGTKPETEKDRAQIRQNNTHNPRICFTQATFAQEEGPVYIVSTQACIGPLTHAFTELYRSEEQRRLFKKSMPLMFCLLAFFVGKKEDKIFVFMRLRVCRLHNTQILNNLKVQVYRRIQRRGCTCTSRHHFQSNIWRLLFVSFGLGVPGDLL